MTRVRLVSGGRVIRKRVRARKRVTGYHIVRLSPGDILRAAPSLRPDGK